jgi:chromosome segregation ATPase
MRRRVPTVPVLSWRRLPRSGRRVAFADELRSRGTDSVRAARGNWCHRLIEADPMASEPSHSDAAQSLLWLEDQRRADQRTIAVLSQDVERLTALAREQENRLSDLGDQVQQLRQGQSRIGLVDDAMRALREQISALGERLERANDAGEHQRLLRSAETERDRKQVVELAGSLADLARQQEGFASRLQAFGDQQRQDRGTVVPLAETVAEFDRRLGTLAQRLQQLDDVHRRQDSHLGDLKSAQDEIAGAVGAAAEAQRLTSVRTTRQFEEWQQTLERWRASVDEAGRPITQLGQQFGQLRAELQRHENSNAEIARRVEELVAASQRVDSLIGAGRDHVTRVEAAVEGQRRRLDEANSTALRVDETLNEHSASLRDVVSRLDYQVAEVRAVQQQVQRLEETDQQMHAAIANLQSASRQVIVDLEERHRAVLDRIESDWQRYDAQRSELVRLLVEQRRRALAQLERELVELGDRGARSDPAERRSG